MSNLRGKIAWVTGAGSGIGEAAALALAAAGATIGRVREATTLAAATGHHHQRDPDNSHAPSSINLRAVPCTK